MRGGRGLVDRVNAAAGEPGAEEDIVGCTLDRAVVEDVEPDRAVARAGWYAHDKGNAIARDDSWAAWGDAAGCVGLEVGRIDACDGLRERHVEVDVRDIRRRRAVERDG